MRNPINAMLYLWTNFDRAQYYLIKIKVIKSISNNVVVCKKKKKIDFQFKKKKINENYDNKVKLKYIRYIRI